VNCAECLTPTETPIAARDGTPLCPRCAETFYVACSNCRGLVPRDEAVAREGSSYCLDCLARAAAPEVEPPGEEQIAALVAEYVRLHAEEKLISARLEEIKEQLKAAADGRPRVAGAVVLRAGGQAVKCSYSVRTAYNSERLAALEAEVGAEMIDTLFERKLSFSPIKESLRAFLDDEDEFHAATRAAIRSAAEPKETVTLTVVPPKKR